MWNDIYCALIKKCVSQPKLTAKPCFDDHQMEKDDVGIVGDLALGCAQIVSKLFQLEFIGLTFCVTVLVCKSSRKVEQSMRSAVGQVDELHHFQEVLWTLRSCW